MLNDSMGDVMLAPSAWLIVRNKRRRVDWSISSATTLREIPHVDDLYTSEVTVGDQEFRKASIVVPTPAVTAARAHLLGVGHCVVIGFLFIGGQLHVVVILELFGEGRVDIVGVWGDLRDVLVLLQAFELLGVAGFVHRAQQEPCRWAFKITKNRPQLRSARVPGLVPIQRLAFSPSSLCRLDSGQPSPGMAEAASGLCADRRYCGTARCRLSFRHALRRVGRGRFRTDDPTMAS